MTHDVLQSDIELATRLKANRCPGDKIIRALTSRGVDAGQAAQLVDDLDKGMKPTSHSALPLEFTMARRSRAKGASHGHAPTRPSRASRAEPGNGSPGQPVGRRRKRTPAFWLKVAVLAVLVITAGSVILIQRDKPSTNALEEQTPKAAMPTMEKAPRAAPAKAPVPSQKVPPPPLVLELQPDGLHLGGNLVTGGNVLTDVANLLGVPTRTNQVGRTATVIYAYDRQGLLIYSQKDGGTNSIVLDCEAIGGPNGTTSPFAGALKIEDRVIGPGTDSQTLAAIKKLELNRPGTGGSVWSGRYNGLDLVFAYLKSPQHLSLIEINLK